MEELRARTIRFRGGDNQSLVLDILRLKYLCNNVKETVGRESEARGGRSLRWKQKEPWRLQNRNTMTSYIPEGNANNEIAHSFHLGKQACFRVRIRKGFEGKESLSGISSRFPLHWGGGEPSINRTCAQPQSCQLSQWSQTVTAPLQASASPSMK